MINRGPIYARVLIILIAMEVLSLGVIITSSTAHTTSTVSDDLYLVNTPDTKVLRVPFLSQDDVRHCWLYSVGMIVAYYRGEFHPDRVLNAVRKGFDKGLYFSEYNRLSQVINSLYGIELSDLREVKDENQLRDIVISEISNARPVVLMTRGHAIVITGFSRNVTGFYLVVNDPSGSLTHIVWNATTRFDGSVADGSEAYGVLVDIGVVFRRRDTSDFFEIHILTIRNAPARPNPPKAVVYAYTSPPTASTYIYDSSRRVFLLNRTRFYHNNYLGRSLWYPIPVVALGSTGNMPIFVYPNTRHQEELYLYVKVKHRDINGLYATVSDRLTVKIHNQSYAEIILPNITRLRYAQWRNNGVDLELPTWSVGTLLIELELREKDTNSTVYVWGPIDLRVYHEIAHLSLNRLSIQANFTAGILYDFLHNTKLIDLYISFNRTGFLSRLIRDIRLELSEPCRIDLSNPQPDPSLGGYYFLCSIRIPQDRHSIDISGDIVLGWLRIPVRETLALSSSGIVRLVQFNIQDFTLSKDGTAKLNFEYCLSSAVRQRYKIAVSLDNQRKYVGDLSRATCGSVIAKMSGAPTIPPIIKITIELLDERGNTVDNRSFFVANPLTISIADLKVPASVASDKYTFVSYDVVIPSSTAKLLNALYFSALIYGNGSKVPSTTWVEKIDEGVDIYRVTMRSYLYVPHCSGGATECTYTITVVPKIGLKNPRYGIIYAYSNDVKEEQTLKIFSARLEERHAALFIVIDVSGSMGSRFKGRTKLDWAKEAATYLVNMALDGDHLGIIAFSGSPRVVHDIVRVNESTRRTLEARILGLTEGGSTNIGDSLKLATDLLRQGHLLGYKRVIVLLTDGIHNTGTHPRNVLSYIRESGVVVYTIGLGDPGDIDEDILNMIAHETGGKYYYAPTPDKLQEIFEHIRGEALALNLINKDIIRLSPNEEYWAVYPLDLSVGDFVVEINWDNGPEPMVVLRFLDIVVDQGNASSIGIQVSHPAMNTLRLTIPNNFSYMYSYLGSASPIIPINISIVNRNQRNTTIWKSIFGGKEVLLEVFIDNPTARYLRGQYLYYRIVAMKNTRVLVVLTDKDGSLLHMDILHVTESTGAHGGTLNHYLKLPEKPGEYYLKVSLFDLFLLRTKVIPITVIDSQYQDPLDIKHTDMVEGFGLIQVPVNIAIKDRSIVGKTLIMQVSLEPTSPYAPSVTIDPQVIKLSSPNQNTSIYIDIPYDATPGEYNLSMTLIVEGHSVIVRRDAIKIRVPMINVMVEGISDVVVARQGEKADSYASLRIIGDNKYGIDVGLRPVFDNQIVNIEGSHSYNVFAFTNSTINVTMKYDTNSIGIHSGFIEVSINGTPVNNLRQTLVVLPREADVNKTIWAHGYNTVVVGPDNSKNISVRLKIDWKSYVAGIVSTSVNPRSKVDYIVYAHSDESGARSLLTVFIPQELRQQGYALFVERDQNIIETIPITPQSDSLDVVVETGHVYRVWVGVAATPTPSPTPTPTPSPTHTPIPTQTQPTTTGGVLPIAASPTTTPGTTDTPPSRLPLIIAMIAIIIVIEVEIILVAYLKKRRR